MATTYISLGYYYFCSLTHSDFEWCPIDPNFIPNNVMNNRDINVIMNKTLPGLSGSTVTSGRTIYVNMGGSYNKPMSQMSIDYPTAAFISHMETLRDGSQDSDFEFGWSTGEVVLGTPPLTYLVLGGYRVNFAQNGLDLSQAAHPTPKMLITLVNLGYIGTWNKLKPS